MYFVSLLNILCDLFVVGLTMQ